jgi:hypothetical protein
VAPLLSPFTEKACVYYDYTVEKYEHEGKTSGWMKVLNYDSQNIPFYLEDGTGKVMIKPAGSDLKAENPYQVEVDRGKNMPRPIADFVKNHLVLDFANSGRFRFTERYVEVGKKVFIMGYFQKKDDIGSDEEAYVGAGPKLGSDFVISDMNRTQVESQISRTLLGRFIISLALIGIGSYFLVESFFG